MKSNDIVAWLGTLVGGTCTGISLATMNQIVIICNLILTIISTIVSIAFIIWKWWKKAKEDGKITEEEIDDVVNQVNDVVNKNNDKKGE